MVPLALLEYSSLSTASCTLTHWGRDKMADISQTTFSNAFSWMNIHQFRLIFHWSLFLVVGINNIPALVQIMAWCRLGDKPLSEPMMVSLLMHTCVTQPQWVNTNLGSMVNVFASWVTRWLIFTQILTNSDCRNVCLLWDLNLSFVLPVSLIYFLRSAISCYQSGRSPKVVALFLLQTLVAI